RRVDAQPQAGRGAAVTRHPLSADLTRAAEAGGALRALLLAEGDERVPECDRVALRRLRERIVLALAATPWAGRATRANVAHLTRALTHDEPRSDVING